MSSQRLCRINLRCLFVCFTRTRLTALYRIENGTSILKDGWQTEQNQKAGIDSSVEENDRGIGLFKARIESPSVNEQQSESEGLRDHP